MCLGIFYDKIVCCIMKARDPGCWQGEVTNAPWVPCRQFVEQGFNHFLAGGYFCLNFFEAVYGFWFHDGQIVCG